MIQEYTKDRYSEVIRYIGGRFTECPYLYIDFKKYQDEPGHIHTDLQYENGKMTAVVLRYHNGVHLFSRDGDIDPVEMIALLKGSSPPPIICGTASLIDKIKDGFPAYISEEGYVGEIREVNARFISEEVRRATEEEIRAAAKLLCEDEGMGAGYRAGEMEDQLLERNRTGFGRNYVIIRDGTVASHVATGAELRDIAVITSGITAVPYRGRNLYTNMLATVSAMLLREKKRVISFYYTPSARRAHEKAGFETVTAWKKLLLK